MNIKFHNYADYIIYSINKFPKIRNLLFALSIFIKVTCELLLKFIEHRHAYRVNKFTFTFFVL